jgi:hypothetical protein
MLPFGSVRVSKFQPEKKELPTLGKKGVQG